MECKFCNALLEENETLCPACGRDQTEEPAPVEEVEEVTENTQEDDRPALTAVSSRSWRSAERSDDEDEEDEDQDANEETAEDADEETEETDEGEELEAPVKKRSLAWIWAVLGTLAVAGIAVLVILLAGKAREPVPDVFLAENRSYSLGNQFMTPSISGKVMASSEKRTIITELKELLGVDPLKEGLTNAELSILYWDTFIGFYQNYSYYIASFGLDITAMDKSMFGDGQNWQEYFLTQAINRYRMQKAVCDDARKTGFVLPEDLQKQLDETIAGFSEEADIRQQLEDIYGPNVTLDMYVEYLKEQYLYSAYVAELTERVEYTDAEIEAYYDENAEYYEQNYVKKVDKNVVTIRHALIAPTDKTVDADWTAAKAKAESLYNEWLAGDKSEESFAELAKANSADGNAAEGGIYEDVYPGMMVAAFNDWCFDDARQVGDHGIVETEFGYHIMYFSGVGDYVYWRKAAETDYVNEKVNDKAVALAESYTLYVDRDKIALALPGQFVTED
mgnify:CR=1 FL=1